MTLTNGVSALDNIRLLDKSAADTHTGDITNVGNVICEAGYFVTNATDASPINLNSRYVLKAGHNVVAHCGASQGYITVSGTRYLPPVMRAFIPFPGRIEIPPTSFAFFPVATPANCTPSGVPASGSGILGQIGCVMAFNITTTSGPTIQTAYAEGYITVDV